LPFQGHFGIFREINVLKLKSLMKKFSTQMHKVFLQFRPRQPKVASAGIH